ncbi:MAG: siroheme synthase CysG [Pseudomonadota bacterium]
MKTFPMFLQMAGRRVVVFGGGEQAAQKTRLMLKTEAEIVIVADTLEPELEGLAAEGRVRHWRGAATADLLDNTILAFAASGCAGADAAHAALAKSCGVTVNVVDMPALCDALTPSIVDRDPVVVAIGTEGTAPVLGRQIKTRIEGVLEPRLGELAAFAGRMRGAVAARVPGPARRGFWRWVFAEAPRADHASGRERDAYAAIKSAIEAGGAPEADRAGSVALVGAGPGAADLMTLRGVKRLQEADVILYDRLSGTDVLELARRDAERICVGKAPGDATLPDRWSQERINRLIVQKAQEGLRVVRLKCGDPGIFARAAEELTACRALDIPCEIVPGITAACAAAAEAGEVLTERDRVDTLVLSTATRSDGTRSRDIVRHLRPGSRVALYMGVGAAPALATEMLQDAPADLPVDIVEAAGHARARTLTCTLDTLAETVAEQAVSHPAMIFIGYPKDHAVSGAAKQAHA